ncbi:MAG: hypothetical protein K8T25_09300 [Planctomycetia bacterium]|nr:hypothetical protein [Planctomycetia bacterium]
MPTEVNATFVNGNFKPDVPVALPDQSRVHLTIEPVSDRRTAAVEAWAAWEAIQARLRERPLHFGGRRFTREQLNERRMRQ